VKKIAFTYGLGLAAMTLAGVASGQSSSQSPLPPVASSATHPAASASTAAVSTAANTNVQNGVTYIEPDQPASVAELARVSRARRARQGKAVEIFDEQNMPHAPIAEGQQAPGYSSGSSGGRVTLIDFWATWCGPCRNALPGLKQLQSIYGNDQIEVVSVSEDEDEDQWRSFVANNGMNWTQKLDADHQMMREYGASALPTYVLIGKDGHVVKQWVGDAEDQTLVDRIGKDLKSSLAAKL
jgi:thiol-disulfide isomerase/thioredoxin